MTHATIRLPVLAIWFCLPALALAQSEPTTSEYLKTAGGGTAVDTKDGVRFAYLGIVLEWRKPVPDQAVVDVEFENPNDRNSPFRVSYTFVANESKFVVRSPSFSCVVNGHEYLVLAKVFSDGSRQVLLGTHEQKIALQLPKRQLVALGIKECGA